MMLRTRMVAPDLERVRGEWMQTYAVVQLYTGLGVVITTVGVLAAGLSLLRRRLDPVLLSLAALALVYGVHLVMEYQMVWYLAMGPPPMGYDRIVAVLAYVSAVPVFVFLEQLRVLGRAGRPLAWVVSPVFVLFALLTLAIGPRQSFDTVVNAAVVVSFFVLLVLLFRSDAPSRDLQPVRYGLVVFVVAALYNGTWGRHSLNNIEPFGFLVMLGALGWVAGRRTLENEERLGVIDKELEIARSIQAAILPGEFPASARFRVAARYLPMTSVAGDFYDFLVAGDGAAGLLIADVSGHGVPAALIASMVKLAATTERRNAERPAELLTGMNTALCGNTQSQFVTAAYVYLHADRRELRYAAAAHPPMLLLRGGAVVEIAENGLMLAAFSFATYAAVSRGLEPGDRLVLYTDGVLEAANAREEEFGAERLRGLVQETAELEPAAAVDRMMAAVRGWAAAQGDDLTMVVCDFLG